MGKTIYCDISEIDTTTGLGMEVAGVAATCQQCGQRTECAGTSERSVKRALSMMRNACPTSSNAFYAAAELAPRGRPPTLRAPAVVGSLIGNAPVMNHVQTASKPSAADAALAAVLQLKQAPPWTEGYAPVPVIAHNKFAVIDIETTGVGSKTAEVVQIGVSQVDNGKPRWRQWTNVKPSKPIPERASAIHGLTDAHVAHAASFGELADQIAEMIEDRVLVMFNPNWALPILLRQCQEAGKAGELLCTAFALAARIDVRDLAVWSAGRLGLPGETNLLAQWHRWGLSGDGVPQPRNIAIEDCRVVWNVFVELATRFKEIGWSASLSALPKSGHKPHPSEDPDSALAQSMDPAQSAFRSQAAQAAFLVESGGTPTLDKIIETHMVKTHGTHYAAPPPLTAAGTGPVPEHYTTTMQPVQLRLSQLDQPVESDAGAAADDETPF